MSDDGPRIFVIPLGDVEGDTEDELQENLKFQRMLHDFEHFAKKSSDPFAPCGFLHKLLDAALDRAYSEAYNAIGDAQDPHPFICAATHIKKCKELSREMVDQLSAAMGDMHRGGNRTTDMLESVKNLMRMINASKS